jgi:dienelactone hydrolase
VLSLLGLAAVVAVTTSGAAAGSAGLSLRGLAGPTSTTVPRRFAVGLRVLRLVDTTRSIHLPNGDVEPRTLVTYVRYPALGRNSAVDIVDARSAQGASPYPLVVFGHGYAGTPALYARLLRAWAQAGYVVAAPVFPLENANAPGGPNERDLVNQPADMSFVITQLLAASSTPKSPLHGMIDPARVAVAGQSDGGETALAAAYDPAFRDRRIRAAVILSGAQIPGAGLAFPPKSPALLATQGSADTVNPPGLTSAFFAIAGRPKFLLTLVGAAHLPPYTDEQPQLGIVERVSISFLDRYLGSGRLRPLLRAGNVPGIARLTADP